MTARSEALNVPSPLQEKYLTARIMARSASLFGPRGERAVRWYSYFRWLDDQIDESPITTQEKLDLLSRQHQVIENQLNESLHPCEEFVAHHGTNGMTPENAQLLRAQGHIMVASIEDDCRHLGLVPRTEREMRHYNWRTLLTPIRALSLILNNQDFVPTRQTMELINAWNSLGGLIDLEEDIHNGALQLTLTQEQQQEISTLPSLPERQAYAKQTITPEVFQEKKLHAVSTLWTHAISFMDTNLPWWQRSAATVYLMTRCSIKGLTQARYPFPKEKRLQKG